MTKAAEKKLAAKIKQVIGDSWKETDSITITDLLDWISIADYCKKELQAEVKQGESLNWQTMTKLSMATKSIQASLKLLGITRQERMKIKVVEEKKEVFDLQKFLNSN